MRSIRNVLHCLEMQYWQTEVAYQQFHARGGTADALVYYLERAVRGEEQEIESLS